MLTNKYNYPEIIVNAIKNKKYSKGDADYSATQLINPPRITILKKRHAGEIVEDVSDRLYSLGGEAMHKVLEMAGMKNAIQEERITTEVLGVKISGQADLYYEQDGIHCLIDAKETSVWTRIFNSRIDDWTRQLNIYSYLFRSIGFNVDELYILVRYRDWKKRDVIKDGYPRIQVEMIPIELWDFEKQQEYIEERVGLLLENEERGDDLDDCTFEERWEKSTQYAVMKKGRKTAIKLYDTYDDAYARVELEGGPPYCIQTRPGERIRCDDYCEVAPFCNQYARWKDGNRS